MPAFRSRFLYPVFVLRILFFLFGITFLGLFIVLGAPEVARQYVGITRYLMIALALAVFTGVVIAGGKGVFKNRFQLSIDNGVATITDLISKNKFYLGDGFKGYSLSRYGNSPWGPDFKTIIFYFYDGRKIEFPQFLYLNFKDIHPALQQNNIPFLGHEPYRWKNPLSRKYFFDRTI